MNPFLKLVKYIFNVNKFKFGKVGTNVILPENGEFGDAPNIVFGDNIYVGPGASFWATGGLQIDDNVIFGPNVVIHTSNHRYDEAESIPYDGVTILRPVHVCQNVWIGANVLITPGVTINEGAVVAMGAVITKDVPSGAVVGGNPAKILKYRNMERYEKLKTEGKFYLKMKAEGKMHWERVLG